MFVSLYNIFQCKIFSDVNDLRENGFFSVFGCIMKNAPKKYFTLFEAT